MGVKKSDPDDGDTIVRRGLFELHIQERRVRSSHPDSGQRNIVPSQLPLRGNATASRAAIKTQGEIEASICAAVSHFHQEYLGRGPTRIQAHLIVDLLLVRLFGVLTVAERQLVNEPDSKNGRDLVKQVRTQLIETVRPLMQSLTEEVTGVQMISLHHDISTVMDEELIVLTLAEPPRLREAAKKGK